MATKNSTVTPGRADHTTAPLSPAASAALARLQLAFLPLDLVRAVTRYEIAAARYDELIARPASTLSPAEFDAFQSAQQTIADEMGVLADAGRLDLIAPVEVAASYRAAEARANELIWSALTTGGMSDLHADDLAHYVDLMAGHKATLADAGRLDLIEVAS